MSISIGPGLYELYIVRTGTKGALDIHSCRDKHAGIDHLIRCLMLDADTDEAKAKVRATVDLALKHMEEDLADDHDCDDDDCQRCHYTGGLPR